MPTLPHWAWDWRTFVSSNAFKMSFISHANPSAINNYLVVPPFCRSFFFIYSRLINAICTCWTTLIIVVMIIMYQRRRVLFLESDLYIFAVTTHAVFDLHMVISSFLILLFQAPLVTMKKNDYFDCSVIRVCLKAGICFFFFIFGLKKE